MAKDRSVSIIVPVLLLPDKDRELTRFTRNCFESIRDRTPPGYELVVVDNGSMVDVEWLEGEADVYIRNERNLGFGPAVNQGLRAASGEWLVVMNNDVVVLGGWLETMQGAWHADTGVVSSHLHDHDPEHKAGRQACHGGYMFGALWLTRREVVDEIGYISEEYAFPGYWEDRDYWKRLEAAGFGLAKAGWCLHVGNATSGKVPEFKAAFAANKKLFLEKWGRGWD